MSVQYAPKGLIGLLTPQANTTAEIEFAALMPRGIEPLVARMTSARPTLESRLIAYFEGLDDTIVQFANAPIGAIAAACTGSSYLIGPEREDQLLNGLSTRFGRPVTSAGRSVVEACKALSARRIALLSPYSDSLTAESVKYWQARGLEVVEVIRIGSDAAAFHPIYAIRSDATHMALRSLTTDRAQAIIALGTGMPSLATVLEHPQWRGAPVFSCMLALAWNAVRLAQGASATAGSLLDVIAGKDWGARFRARF
jgi:maleate cis-trans isomerase